MNVKVIKTASAAMGALLLPMLPGMAAALAFQVYRPWFWAEFALLALAARGRPLWFAAGLALLWLADFLFAFAQINLSSDYGDAAELLSFLPYANTGWILAGIVGLVALAAWGWLCVWLHRMGSPGRFMLMWSLAIVGVAVVVPRFDGFDHAEDKLYGIRQAKLAGSWLLDSRLMRQSMAFYEEGYAPDVGMFRPIAPKQSAMSRLGELGQGAAMPDKLLLIVVESWGLAHGEAENQFWRDLWRAPGLRQLDAGTVHSLGSTLQGEFRELCGMLPQTLRIDDVPHAEDCLPSRLRAQGWQTQAFHGASPRMYKRSSWYPQVGFEHLYFLPELMVGGKLCANVPGTCDHSIAERVVQTLREPGRQFSYWMTLNSHTPYKLADLSSPDVPNHVCPVLQLAGARCAHAALLYDFMRSLKVALLHKPVPGLRIVLVGDHEPKFFDADSRDAFVEGQVPYLVIGVD
ncbi:MAG: sulfatase-like hydrolase/transferase [Comamonas sp.]|jgi:hypothetical protein|nr:sulfatase-like hydrolase/transferase [Comamonas sp.]